jgi:hypothetical protein
VAANGDHFLPKWKKGWKENEVEEDNKGNLWIRTATVFTKEARRSRARLAKRQDIIITMVSRNK